MKPKFKTREEVIAYIREQTHCGLQHAQAILEFVEQNSLTLRDEFAARAMQTLLATLTHVDLETHGVKECQARIAAGAYAQANAMLSERAK